MRNRLFTAPSRFSYSSQGVEVQSGLAKVNEPDGAEVHHREAKCDQEGVRIGAGQIEDVPPIHPPNAIPSAANM